MRAAPVTTLIVAAFVFHAAAARAQSRVEVVPSVTVGSIYDDNLFAQVQGDAGQMLAVRPGVEARIDTPRLSLGSLWTFDSQRSNHADLTMVDARRHADLNLHYRTTDATTLGLNTAYDRTETPGEINLESGILSDRRQAHRLELSPNFSHRVRPHTSIAGSYDWTTESLVDNGTGRMQVVRATLSQQYTTRSTVSGTVMERHFADPTDISNGSDSYALLAGWDHQLSASSRVTLIAGPRVTSYRGLEPEVTAAYGRTTNRMALAADYWHGETIVLGIHGPVAINSGTARVSWPIRRTIDVGSHSAVSAINTLDQHQLTSYRETIVTSWSPGGYYTFAASYGVDYQQGNIRHNVFSSTDVLRHVFGVSLTVAPRLSRSIQSPDDPAARSKGVSQ